MQISWLESFRFPHRVLRRRKRSLGTLRSLESRRLLSVVGVAQPSAAVEAPAIYGPAQLSASDSSAMGTADVSVTRTPEPIPLPPTPEDYNGFWSLEAGTSLDLKINSKATKIKGKLKSTFFGDLKFKGKLDGVNVTGIAKGKTVYPAKGKGKLVIHMTFTLIDTTHWGGEQESYFKNEFINSGIIGATKNP